MCIGDRRGSSTQGVRYAARTTVTPGTWPSARCHKPARPGTLGADLLADRAHRGPDLLADRAHRGPHNRSLDHVYIVHGSPSPSLSVPSSSPPHAQHRAACTMTLSTSNSHAAKQLPGSMSQDAINESPHTHCRPAMTFPCNKQMVYGLRPRARKPARRDPLLTACHDALPPEMLRHILLLRVAMPHNYQLRSRRHGCSGPGPGSGPRRSFGTGLAARSR